MNKVMPKNYFGLLFLFAQFWYPSWLPLNSKDILCSKLEKRLKLTGYSITQKNFKEEQ